jgi:hypothetical protein
MTIGVMTPPDTEGAFDVAPRGGTGRRDVSRRIEPDTGVMMRPDDFVESTPTTHSPASASRRNHGATRSAPPTTCRPPIVDDAGCTPSSTARTPAVDHGTDCPSASATAPH